MNLYDKQLSHKALKLTPNTFPDVLAQNNKIGNILRRNCSRKETKSNEQARERIRTCLDVNPS